MLAAPRPFSEEDGCTKAGNESSLLCLVRAFLPPLASLWRERQDRFRSLPTWQFSILPQEASVERDPLSLFTYVAFFHFKVLCHERRQKADRYSGGKEYSWVIKRRFSDFQALDAGLRRATCNKSSSSWPLIGLSQFPKPQHCIAMVEAAAPESASALLSHLAKPETEARDPALICWAAAGLERQAASESLPSDAAHILCRCFASIGDSNGGLTDAFREAVAPMLAALGHLLRSREGDRQRLRDALVQEATSGALRWLQKFRELLEFPAPFGAAEAAACEVLDLLCRGDEDWDFPTGAPQAPKATLRPSLSLTLYTNIFVISRIFQELTTHLHRHRLLTVVSRRLLATSSEEAAAAPGWRHFAAFGVRLLEALMTEEDTDRFRLAAPPLFKPVWACREKPDAPRQALLAMLPGSEEAVSATPLEVSALSALGQLARRSEEQARLILRSPALQQSFKILDRCACDEEGINERYLSILI
eukprot:s1863_g13.t1